MGAPSPVASSSNEETSPLPVQKPCQDKQLYRGRIIAQLPVVNLAPLVAQFQAVNIFAEAAHTINADIKLTNTLEPQSNNVVNIDDIHKDTYS